MVLDNPARETYFPHQPNKASRESYSFQWDVLSFLNSSRDLRLNLLTNSLLDSSPEKKPKSISQVKVFPKHSWKIISIYFNLESCIYSLHFNLFHTGENKNSLFCWTSLQADPVQHCLYPMKIKNKRAAQLQWSRFLTSGAIYEEFARLTCDHTGFLSVLQFDPTSGLIVNWTLINCSLYIGSCRIWWSWWVGKENKKMGLSGWSMGSE